MLKLTLFALIGLLSIGCSETHFASGDEQAFLASGITCNDDKCTTYTVNESAKNPELNSKTNILFVFDTSGSMAEENKELANRMAGFIEGLEAKGVHYNICYTIADDSAFKSGLVKRWTNGDSVLNNQTANVASVFSETADSIKDYRGSSVEAPIEAAYNMIASEKNTDCLQKNIPLEVVILSDEDELECADHCSSSQKFSHWIKGIKLRTGNYPVNLIKLAEQKLPQTAFTVNAIVKQRGVSDCSVDKEDNGVFHAQLARLTGGVLGDICIPDYTSQLDAISKSIQKTLNDIPLRCNPLNGIKLVASNGMTFQQEIIKKRLHLTPSIPARVDVELTYDCKAE